MVGSWALGLLGVGLIVFGVGLTLVGGCTQHGGGKMLLGVVLMVCGSYLKYYSKQSVAVRGGSISETQVSTIAEPKGYRKPRDANTSCSHCTHVTGSGPFECGLHGKTMHCADSLTCNSFEQRAENT